MRVAMPLETFAKFLRYVAIVPSSSKPKLHDYLKLKLLPIKENLWTFFVSQVSANKDTGSVAFMYGINVEKGEKGEIAMMPVKDTLDFIKGVKSAGANMLFIETTETKLILKSNTGDKLTMKAQSEDIVISKDTNPIFSEYGIIYTFLPGSLIPSYLVQLPAVNIKPVFKAETVDLKYEYDGQFVNFSLVTSDELRSFERRISVMNHVPHEKLIELLKKKYPDKFDVVDRDEVRRNLAKLPYDFIDNISKTYKNDPISIVVYLEKEGYKPYFVGIIYHSEWASITTVKSTIE